MESRIFWIQNWRPTEHSHSGFTVIKAIFDKLRRTLLYSKVAKAELHLMDGHHNEWLELTYYIETLVYPTNYHLKNKREIWIHTCILWRIETKGSTDTPLLPLSLHVSGNCNVYKTTANLFLFLAAGRCLRQLKETHFLIFTIFIFGTSQNC